MINKLTRWNFSEFDNCLEISHDGDLVDFDEVKELFIKQEKELELYKTVYENRELIKLWENLGVDDKHIEYQRVVNNVENLQELLAKKENKINILLEALGEISKMYDEDDDPKDWHHITCANKALEEYKKEQ